MKPERWEQVAQLHRSALKVEKGRRAAFLQEACAGDKELRREVESLLAYEGEAEDFMEAPAHEVVAKQLAERRLEHMALNPGDKLGVYEVVGSLGAGGMGEVYRARDTSLKRDVAIKVIPASLSRDPDRLRRFELEAQAAAALNHPSILSIFHIGLHENSPFIVSELLEGETLGDRLRRGPMPRQEAVAAAVGVARGLAVAHEKGIVHRDLKPDNLFLTKDGRVKILDFGLAKLTQAQSSSPDGVTAATREHTEPGHVLGTVGYMSPEQVRGQPADARSDIFALGCVLYEMLTGKRAFRKATAAETMSAILNEDPAPISQVNANIPPGLQRTTSRCLEKNPDRRFQSASDLAFALEALSDSGSSPTGVMRQFNSRRVLVWTIAALVVAALGIGLYLRRNSPATAPGASRSSLEVTALTQSGNVLQAAASPDGRYVAYEQNEAGKFDLRLLQVATGRPIQLLPGSPMAITSLHFSPDSSFIYFLRQLDDSDALGVFRIATLGGPVTRVATDARGRSVTVSPDGKQIAYITQTPNESVVVAVDPEGANRRILATRPAALGFRYIEWSPSQDTMAAVATVTQSMSIGLLSLDTRSASIRDLSVSGWATIGQPAWSPDGGEIYAPAVPIGRLMPMMQIWEFNARTGDHTPLTSGSTQYRLSTLSATTTGDLIANTKDFSLTLWVTNAGGQLRQIPATRSEGWDSVAWVGKQIVAGTLLGMMVHGPDGGNSTEFRSHSTVYRGLIRCGPERVAYFALDTEHQGYTERRDITTGATSALTDGPRDGGSTCTPDGSTLIYVRCAAQGNRCVLTRKSLDSAQSLDLYEVKAADEVDPSPALSPDGTNVLFIHQFAAGGPYEFATVPIGGGELQKIAIPVAAGDAGAFKWAPDGKSILYVREDAGVGNIWSAPIGGKTVRRLTDFKSDKIFSFDISSDNRLVIARGNMTSDIVIIRMAK